MWRNRNRIEYELDVTRHNGIPRVSFEEYTRTRRPTSAKRVEIYLPSVLHSVTAAITRFITP